MKRETFSIKGGKGSEKNSILPVGAVL